MHSSWGNTIDAPDAFARMGADVMRWQFCAQPPDRNLLFGFGPAHEIKRKLLTLWNSATFLVQYANVEAFAAALRTTSSAGPTASSSRSTAGSSSGRAQLVARRPPAYERWLTVDVIARLRGVRRRRLELVHPPLATALLGRRRGRVPRPLARARPGAARDRAGDAVPRRAPVADRSSASRAPTRRRACTSPAGRRGRPGRRAARRDRRRAARRRASVTRRARRRGFKVRQPLRALVVEGAPLAAAHADEIARRAARQGGRASSRSTRSCV